MRAVEDLIFRSHFCVSFSCPDSGADWADLWCRSAGACWEKCLAIWLRLHAGGALERLGDSVYPGLGDWTGCFITMAASLSTHHQ